MKFDLDWLSGGGSVDVAMLDIDHACVPLLRSTIFLFAAHIHWCIIYMLSMILEPNVRLRVGPLCSAFGFGSTLKNSIPPG